VAASVAYYRVGPCIGLMQADILVLYILTEDDNTFA